MCCRFACEEYTENEVKRIASAISREAAFPKGEIRPADAATILTGSEPGIFAQDMRWGFPLRDLKQLLINARAETALEKKAFSESTLYRRCVIPAEAFFEWSRDKQKVKFSLPGVPVLFMAGIYQLFEGEYRFTVLTTAANASVRPVHHRMPLLLKESQLKDWIYDFDMAKELLNQEGPGLERFQEYEQLTLFGLGY